MSDNNLNQVFHALRQLYSERVSSGQSGLDVILKSFSVCLSDSSLDVYTEENVDLLIRVCSVTHLHCSF